MPKVVNEAVVSPLAAHDLYNRYLESANQSGWDRVQTDPAELRIFMQRQFVVPSEHWTDITNLDLDLYVAPTNRGSRIDYWCTRQTNNLMNNEPWQVSNFLRDIDRWVREIAAG